MKHCPEMHSTNLFSWAVEMINAAKVIFFNENDYARNEYIYIFFCFFNAQMNVVVLIAHRSRSKEFHREFNNIHSRIKTKRKHIDQPNIGYGSP